MPDSDQSSTASGRGVPPLKTPAPAAARVGPFLVVVLGSLLVGCSDAPSMSCAEPAASCTVGEAATEIGRFAGTTSEAQGWTNEPVGELVRRHFNSVTSQNELKWGRLVRSPGVYDFAHADETVAFAQQHGLRMRGHVLFWHRLNGPPAWLDAELDTGDPEARLRELIREHAHAVVGRYKGRIHTWDVVNEPLAILSDHVDPESIFFQTFARYEDFLDLAFQSAREADPEAKLFLNEIFASVSQASFDGLYALVRGMIERGTPIDGVGFQGHFILSLPEREQLQERLQAFADLGLIVEITELDVSISLLTDSSNPLAAQAEVYRDVFAACHAVSACAGITTWNSHDGATWLDRDAGFAPLGPHAPTLFDEELQPKPSYTAARDALLRPDG